MKVTAIIPARANSERFPGKNHAMFLGKPLFMHSVNFARESNLIDNFFISTNDKKIITISKQAGIPYIKRPDKLSTPFSTNSEYIGHFLNNISKIGVELPDILLILQPTDPIREDRILREMLNLYKRSNPDSVFTVVKSKLKMGSIVNGTFRPYNYEFEQRFQDMEPFYEENGMFFLVNVSSFLKNGIMFGDTNVPYIIPEIYRNTDIDTQLEMDIAELVYSKNF